MKLPLLDHLCWLALRRVRRGGVIRLHDRYCEGGLPLGVLLVELLDELREHGMLAVADPDPADGLARVHLTDAGQAHYRELCRRQRAPVPVPEFARSAAQTGTRAPVGRCGSGPVCGELPAEGEDPVAGIAEALPLIPVEPVDCGGRVSGAAGRFPA